MLHQFRLTSALAVATVIALSTAAAGADLGGYEPRYQVRAQPESRAPIWAGAYMGANIGYGTGDVWEDGQSGRLHTAGVVGGLHAGYNWQFGSFVVGGEGDFDISGMRGHVASGNVIANAHTRHFSSLRGRMGFAFDKALIYGTAGYGWNDVHVSWNDVAGHGSTGHANSGLVYGGGLEYKLTRNLSLRGEVLRYDVSGHWDLDNGSKATVHNPSTEFRTGLTWHFN